MQWQWIKLLKAVGIWWSGKLSCLPVTLPISLSGDVSSLAVVYRCSTRGHLHRDKPKWSWRELGLPASAQVDMPIDGRHMLLARTKANIHVTAHKYPETGAGGRTNVNLYDRNALIPALLQSKGTRVKSGGGRAWRAPALGVKEIEAEVPLGGMGCVFTTAVEGKEVADHDWYKGRQRNPGYKGTSNRFVISVGKCD